MPLALVDDFDEPEPKPAPPRAAPPSHEVMTALSAVASVLTVRLALLLAVIGAFALAILVVMRPSDQAVWVLGIYCMIMIPLAWLAPKRVA